MKNIRVAIACLSLSLALAAPSLSAQKRKPAAPPAAAVPSPLDRTLADLERITAATDNDIGNLKSDKKGFNWKTSWMFWRRDSPRSPHNERMASSLQHNLHDAMPGLIHDARNSPGNFSATFRLYNNLSVACELLDSLVDSTRVNGKKDGDSALTADAAAMGRIRQDVATYIEQMAAALDRGKLPFGWSPSVPAATASNTGKTRKIVIDDNIPEKKTVNKASQQ